MRRYLNEKSPNKIWELKEVLGNKFEDLIVNLIINQLKTLHPSVTVHQTSRSADGGKDIIVTSQIDNLNILGQKFVLNGKNEIKIFFECKSSENSIISYDKICSSFTRSKYQNIDYYVLVTNCTILPQAYWFIENELGLNNISFKLIDSFLLGTFIANFATPNFNHTINNPYDNTCSADFHFEYQVDAFKEQFINKYDIYIIFRNYTSDNKLCKLKLVTDVNWSLDANEMSFIIDPQGAVIKKVTVQQNHFDGIPDLLFKIQINKTESDIMISGINDAIIFDPPFFGASRRNMLDILYNQIKSNQSPSVICFWGETGIGKTRIVEELMLKLNGTAFDFLECKLIKGQDFEQKIIEFLKEHDYINPNTAESFSSIINMYG